MASVADQVHFNTFSVVLDKIANKTGTENKKKVLKEFIATWRGCHAELHNDSHIDTTDSFYPAMRLLLPQLDRERGAYGIKEHTLAKLYIEILGLGKESAAAKKLLNFRTPKSTKGDAGDFASVAYSVLQSRCPQRGTLSIADVNELLDAVAATGGAADAGSRRAGVRAGLLRMLRATSAREQKWLLRVLLRDMRLGVSQASVLDAFHEDAQMLFNVNICLQKVCTTLHKPSTRLHEVEIALNTPFRPMLGDRAAPNKIEGVMKGEPFFLETKYDGERMQLHMENGHFRYFSRGALEYTHVYGGDARSGNFTPAISHCFNGQLQSCILDGEMVGYNPETKTIGSKGEQFDIKSKDLKRYQPMMFVFDILLHNGRVLTNQPLRERRKILDRLFEPVEGRIQLSEVEEGTTQADCVAALNRAIDAREEGIMVKAPGGVYRPNARRAGWYKLKPEYVGGLMDELDVVVVGGYYGAGRRAGAVSHFLCAVAAPPAAGAAADDRPQRFMTFCRVGSGYSHSELFEFNRRLAAHWAVFDRRAPPAWLQFAPGIKQKPDLIIEPANSSILQVKATEIVDSEQYATRCTLRFPRVERIRDDKPWYDCLNYEQLNEMRQKCSGKLTGRHVTEGDVEGTTERKRRKVTAVTPVKPTVMARFRATDVSTVTMVSGVLRDKELCVVNGSASHPKAELEMLVARYGGTLVQNPGSDTFCVIAEKIVLRVRNIIGTGVHDVLKADWLLRCADRGQLLPWRPSDMIHTSVKTQQQLSLLYDRYGDSYYDDTSPEDLKKVFQAIDNTPPISNEEIAEIEMKYFPTDSIYGLFRLCRVYVDSCSSLGDPTTLLTSSPLRAVGLHLRLHGATLSDRLDPRVSHVIVDTRDASRLSALREENGAREKKFHVVSARWVSECLERRKLLPEWTYAPRDDGGE